MAKPLISGKSSDYRRLKPSELEKLGFSKKAERYIKGGQTISKRDYLKLQRAERDIFETNESLAKKYKKGEITYKNEKLEKAAKAKRTSAKAKRYNKLLTKPRPKRKSLNNEVTYETWDVTDWDDLQYIFNQGFWIGKTINIVYSRGETFATVRYLVSKNSTVGFITDIANQALNRYGELDNGELPELLYIDELIPD